jgi:hypothetical protein
VQGKVVEPKWILASYYLAEVYRQSADRGFRPINLNVTNAAEFMEHLARMTPKLYEEMKPAVVAPMNERLSKAFLNVIWSRGRKHNADDRVDMERLAEKFLDEHRVLIAELALTAPAKELKEVKL